MPELGSLGSVRGALSNGRPYREQELGLSKNTVADIVKRHCAEATQTV